MPSGTTDVAVRAGLAALLVASDMPAVAAVAIKSGRQLSAGDASGCPLNCSGHGVCTPPSTTCACFSGWSGEGCEIEKASKCPFSCFGHGWCVHGTCLCEEFWTGKACDVPSKCPNRCSGFGTCVHGECACDELHRGADCSIPRPTCPGWPHSCGGPDRGVCTDAGVCKCRLAYAGDSCHLSVEETACPIRESDGATCWGNGQCESSNGTTRGRCKCDPGFGGRACEHAESELALSTLLLIIGLLIGALLVAGSALLAWCVFARGLLLRELLRGRWRRVAKEEGWRHCEVDGQIEGARFERFFGDLDEYEDIVAESMASAASAQKAVSRH